MFVLTENNTFLCIKKFFCVSMNLIMDKNSVLNYTKIKLAETTSTNAYALEHIVNFQDRTVVYTPHQTAGRGRYSRKWVSDGSENVYMSFVLTPENVENYPFSNLTQYLSVIVRRYLKSRFDTDSFIKWPNDILVNGAKISGILAEARACAGQINSVVLGLGLNVNMSRETLNTIDQKAISLSVLKNELFDIDKIVEEISDLFFESYDDFIKNGFDYIKEEYISYCKFPSDKVTVREIGGEKQYKVLSIDDDGFLNVKDNNDKVCKIIAGDLLC